ncbi:hypothetical protein [Mycobacterium sp. M23085]|uniref:hypothetical protein n=1 Tax=Mycobacterium sp. M23085 TaxID=3378087 RepID=UPI003877C6DA
MTQDGPVPSPVDDSTGPEKHNQLDYQELDSTARAIASNMQRRGAAGARIAARAIGIRRSAAEVEPASPTDSAAQSEGTLRRKATSPDYPVWNFVTRTSLGNIDTYLWHREGTNEFCWRPVGKHWGTAETATDEPE